MSFQPAGTGNGQLRHRNGFATSELKITDEGKARDKLLDTHETYVNHHHFFAVSSSVPSLVMNLADRGELLR